MNELENCTIDILRVFKLKYSQKFMEVSVVAGNHFKYDGHVKLAADIEKRIVQMGFAASTEDGKIFIYPLGYEYLDSITTDEYIVDRCFEEMKKRATTPFYIVQLLDKQKLKFDSAKQDYLEALIIESGLVDSSKSSGAYHYTLKLKPKGLVALNAFDKYSHYKKDLAIKEYNKNTPHLAKLYIDNSVNTTNTSNTYGDQSPSTIGEINVHDIKKEVNKESDEQKTIAKKGLQLNKWMLILTVVGIIVAIAIYLLQRGGKL